MFCCILSYHTPHPHTAPPVVYCYLYMCEHNTCDYIHVVNLISSTDLILLLFSFSVRYNINTTHRTEGELCETGEVYKCHMPIDEATQGYDESMPPIYPQPRRPRPTHFPYLPIISHNYHLHHLHYTHRSQASAINGHIWKPLRLH